MKLYNKFFSRWTGVAMLATMGLFACQPDIETETPTSGTADFTTYVALGNSLTAGFADGGVYRESQENSYPEMMAKSMKEVNPSLVFKTPLMPVGNGSGYRELKDGVPTAVPADPNAFVSVTTGGPYQNLGVPGARVKSLTQVGYGSPAGNPYFTRFASAPLTTVVDDAKAQNPTFFTLWIGNNDVLGYATSGGDQGGDAITPVAEFQTDFDKIMAGMNNAKGGAIANIPNILAAPFFTYVEYNTFPVTAQQATELNAGIRANVTVGVRPAVEAGVRVEVRKKVEAGAIETIIRPQVLAGVKVKVQADVRTGLIAKAVAEGATQEQAEAGTDAFLLTADGKALVQSKYEEFIASDTGKAVIKAQIDGALAAPSTQALIEQKTDEQMQTAEVKAIIETTLKTQLDKLLASITVKEGKNPFIIQGERTQANPIGLRAATSKDLILLTAGGYLGAEAAAGRPPLLSEAYVLDVSEQGKINKAIEEYNAVIQAAAGSKYAYVDVNAFFSKVISGFSNQGVTYNPTFITGGAFSLDGIHLTQRGYALAGNEFIKAINAKYNSRLTLINVNDYRGVLFY